MDREKMNENQSLLEKKNGRKGSKIREKKMLLNFNFFFLNVIISYKLYR